MSDFAAKSARVALARTLGSPVSYTVIINEEQRLALLRVLDGNVECEPEGMLDFWPEMLSTLPAAEAKSPGCLHGFCL